MTDAKLVAASDACYYDGWRMMAEAAGGLAEEAGGILIAAPGVLPMWVNVLFVTRPLDDPERDLTEAFAKLDARSILFLVRVRDGADPASERAAEQLGLRYTDSIPGMALAPLRPGGRETDLDIRPVEDDATFAHFVAVIAASFGFADEAAARMLPPSTRSTPGTFWYVGYAEGEPVAASQLMLLDGDAAGVNFIGTLEGHRGRGYGEAVTQRVVDKAAEEGRSIAVLQASEMGRPVYERMGFRTVAQYKTFVRPEWIE